MLAFKIIFGIFLILSYIAMMTAMIIFERDKPRNIILWSLLFLFTQLIGYAIYLVARKVFFMKRTSLETKKKEDEIYTNLISSQITDGTQTDDELFAFSSLAFDAKVRENNTYEFINKYENVKKKLIKDMKSAKSYIIFELTKMNFEYCQEIVDMMISKANEGVVVKFVHDRLIDRKIIKKLKKNGVKVYRFSKYNTIGRVYSSIRNQIVIDGNIAYLGNLFVKNREVAGKYVVSDMFMRLSGDIVRDIDINTHKDVIFASGKFIDYTAPEATEISEKAQMQFISNQIETDIELMIIKAICSAKKSIQLQLEEFIPTESIMSLLKFAINSNIDVRLMVPLKTNKHSKYFASRAYAKELALTGANVYLFDGFIRFNSIVIDNNYVFYGSYVLDREHISVGPQNMLIIKDNKAIDFANKMFNDGVNNSYRISNAKYMLTREKFFKNFV
ncbi:MAG: hypothetical protein IKM43_01330 [Clostridia bacterium]|nr:hypothetical protein [Clostridia bacterium]